VNTWLQKELSEVAADRILDAAGAVFAVHGVAATGIAEVVAAAGCSRTTFYRYFESKEALRTAYMSRAARAIGASVIAENGSLVDQVLHALRLVRADPALMSWFSPADAGLTVSLAQSSEVIEATVVAVLGDGSDPTTARRAEWLVRVVVSLLSVPGAGEDDERSMLEEFVLPVVVAAPVRPRPRSPSRRGP
jgi:AcrR family transcriptional regulator